jgi:hypothetical protein
MGRNATAQADTSKRPRAGEVLGDRLTMASAAGHETKARCCVLLEFCGANRAHMDPNNDRLGEHVLPRSGVRTSQRPCGHLASVLVC